MFSLCTSITSNSSFKRISNGNTLNFRLHFDFPPREPHTPLMWLLETKNVAWAPYKHTCISTWLLLPRRTGVSRINIACQNMFIFLGWNRKCGVCHGWKVLKKGTLCLFYEGKHYHALRMHVCAHKRRCVYRLSDEHLFDAANALVMCGVCVEWWCVCVVCAKYTHACTYTERRAFWRKCISKWCCYQHMRIHSMEFRFQCANSSVHRVFLPFFSSSQQWNLGVTVSINQEIWMARAALRWWMDVWAVRKGSAQKKAVAKSSSVCQNCNRGVKNTCAQRVCTSIGPTNKFEALWRMSESTRPGMHTYVANVGGWAARTVTPSTNSKMRWILSISTTTGLLIRKPHGIWTRRLPKYPA